ncbi:30S ribosomal protein S31, mitochondrial [Lactuca sativa]|uniref:30S ribosomal protein S31, mitochondrial n=1 Tax=Lactuca sativa TaxID=4236 RepID=UPI000CD9EEC6|nr:30S ribosomal protein S31, mitochondrial [Lactuca sativa]
MAMLIQRWGTTAKRLLLTAEQRYAFTSLSPSSTSTAPAPSPVLCGRGDKRTKKGKIFKGSYGNSRPKKEKKIQRIKDKLEVPRSTPWPLPFKLI